MNFNEELAVAGALELTDSELETAQGAHRHHGGNWGYGDSPNIIVVDADTSSPCDDAPYAYAPSTSYPIILGQPAFSLGFDGFDDDGRSGHHHHRHHKKKTTPTT